MKRLIAIFLSVFMLASSSGIAYAQHFCGDFEMVSRITLGETQLSCGMAMTADSCADKNPAEHDCCDNEYTQVETDSPLLKTSQDLQAFPYISAVINPGLQFIPLQNFPENDHFFNDYNPPPLLRDIPVLYETFLI